MPGERLGWGDAVSRLLDGSTWPSTDEQLWALRQALEGSVRLPADAFVIGEPVEVVEVDYDGNTRGGLTARCCRQDGGEHVVAASELAFPEGSDGARHVAAYRKWPGSFLVLQTPISLRPHCSDWRFAGGPPAAATLAEAKTL